MVKLAGNKNEKCGLRINREIGIPKISQKRKPRMSQAQDGVPRKKRERKMN